MQNEWKDEARNKRGYLLILLLDMIIILNQILNQKDIVKVDETGD